MRRCLSCICHTCLRACCNRRDCKGKVTDCKRYVGFNQLSIFGIREEPKHKAPPRDSWGKYDRLGDKSYRKSLYIMCRSGKYKDAVRRAAYQTNEDIAEYIIKSVTKNKSYEKVEFDLELGRICVGKTDFYGYRRYFFHLFDLEVRRMGK